MHNTNDEFIKSFSNIPPEFVCDNVKLSTRQEIANITKFPVHCVDIHIRY